MFKKVLAVVTIAAAAGVAGMLGLAPLAAQQGPSATRSFDETPMAPGGDVVVTITAANYGQLGGVTESWPGELTYAESSLDDSQVTIIDDVTARFTLQGDTSFTYTLTAPTEPGTYEGFSGTLRDEDRNDHPVGGDDDTVTVAAVTEATSTPSPTPDPTETPTPDPSATSATRSFDETPVAPGGDVVVTITAANYGQLGGVTESWPDGLTYAESSLRDSQVTIIDDVTARFTLQGDASFTYTLTAPTEPGAYEGFSGTLRDEDRNDHPVGGDDDTVTVAAATPTPTPTPEPTATPEPTPTTDAVMVTNVRIGRVRETLITLSWDALEGAAGYKVQWKSGSLDWSEGRQLETSSTAITLRRLRPSTEYSVRVSATDVGTWSEAVTASTVGPDDDTGSPFPTMTPTPTATPEAPPPTPIPPTTMIATSTAATLMSADGTVTLELPADARSEAYQVNLETEANCSYAGAKADVTFTCITLLLFDSEDMLETDVAFDAAPTIAFQLSAEQVKALGGEFLLTKLHEMGGLMIVTRASDGAAWTALAGTTLTFDDETGGAVLAGWPDRLTTFTAVAGQAAYDAVQEMYGHLLAPDTLVPATGGPSIPGVALLALLLGSVALLSAGWLLTARRSGA